MKRYLFGIILALVPCGASALFAQNQTTPGSQPSSGLNHEGRDVAFEGERPLNAGCPPGVALVAANDNYQHVSDLKYAISDGQRVASVLAGAGWETVSTFDATLDQFDEAKTKFLDRIRALSPFCPAGVQGAVYWAGHGASHSKIPYLVPVDFHGRSGAQLRATAIDIDELLSEVQDAGARVSWIVTDACRTPMLPGGRSFDYDGLAPVAPAMSSLIIYAATRYQKALESSELGGGIFTFFFIKRFSMNSDLERMFEQVRRDVVTFTEGRQLPAIASSLVPGSQTDPPYLPDGAGAHTGLSGPTMERGTAAQVPLPGFLDGYFFPESLPNELAAQVDPAAAARVVEAANAGNPQAQILLAELSCRGDVVPRDLEKAKQLLERAAARSELGAIHLASKLADGTCLGRDPERAVQIFTRVATLTGHSFAMARLALHLHTGDGVPANAGSAMSWASKSAETGDPNGMLLMAELLDADGTDESRQRATGLITRAARFGLPGAALKLAERTFVSDPTQAMQLLSHPSISNRPRALELRAHLWFTGSGVERNLQLAEDHSRRACKEGAGGGCLTLAKTLSLKPTMLARTEAVNLLARLAITGSREATLLLADLCLVEGMPLPNPEIESRLAGAEAPVLRLRAQLRLKAGSKSKETLDLLRQASEKGDHHSMVLLALQLGRGRESKKWLEQAKSLGNKNAEALLNRRR